MRNICIAVVVSVLAVVPAFAGRNEDITARMGMAQKRHFESLSCFSQGALVGVTNRVSEEALRRRTEEIMALDSLAPGVRKHDADGRAAIHRYLLEKCKSLEPAGLKFIGSLRTVAGVPVAVGSNGVPASIAVGDQSWTVYPFWPNGPMPSLCPSEGLEGQLVDVGDGSWEALNGLDLRGAIAVMDFRGGRNWDRLSSLGCQAVIAVEDAYVSRSVAEGFFCTTPVPFPRYYVDAAAGAALRAKAARRTPGGATGVVAAARCRLEGGSIYENRPFESFFVYLPPTAPLAYKVRERDLLDRIAVQHGVSVADLVQENNLSSGEVAVGQKLNIPNQPRAYVVKAGDLLVRLAQEYGVDIEVLKATNGLTGVELKTGQDLTIPNLDESSILMARLDSVSSVPDLPHGGKVAANLAFALSTLEHMAGAEGIVRRRGLVVGFLDGDNHGGLASRLLAEYTLLEKGELRSLSSKQAGAGMYRFLVVMGLLVVFGGAGLLTAMALVRRAKEREAGATVSMRWSVAIGLAIGSAGIIIGLVVPLPTRAGSESASEEMRIRRYETLDGWLAGDRKVNLDAATARWVVDDWLLGKVEKRRVLLAEARNALVKAEVLAGSDEDRRRVEAQRRETDRRIEKVVQVRNRSIKKGSLDSPAQLREFFAAVSEPDFASEMREQGLTDEALQKVLRAEFAEERQRQTQRVSNLASVRELQRYLRPQTAATVARKPVLGWLLDVSAGTRLSGFQHTGSGDPSRAIPPPGNSVRGILQDRFHDACAYAGAQAGWTEDWTFIPPESVRSEFVVLPIDRAPVYAEFWAAAGVAAFPFNTLNDTQDTLDTPRDTPANMDMRNFSVQARTLLVCLTLGMESPADVSPPSQMTPPKFGRVVGSTVQFNIRSGIDAKDPVPYAWVYSPAVPKRSGGVNPSTKVGCRIGAMTITLLNGSYSTPLEVVTYEGKMNIYGFTFDRKSALFDMILDAAQIGTQKQVPKYALMDGLDVEKNLILTAAYPKVLFLDVDTVDYKDDAVFEIQDAVLNGPPAHYGVIRPDEDFGESEISAKLIFLQPGRRMRVIGRRGQAIKSLLVGPLAETVQPGSSGSSWAGSLMTKILGGGVKVDFKGRGYEVGPRGTDRNLYMDVTPLSVARDMNELAAKRIGFFRQFGIRDRAVEEALELSQSKLADAQKAALERRWQAATGNARESWGIVQKHYPRIMKLGREAVFSVVLLMALLVPASAFLEKLLLGGKTIARQLGGTVVIFVTGAVFLNNFHPAFKVALSPFIIMIAFVMILMSVVVLGICYQRFEVLVRRARIQGGEAESEEISLASSLGTAFSLGVSNLKKRPSRTALTAFTVAVLTFSIITFVSVTGQEELTARPVELDRDVEGVLLKIEEVEQPRYTGVLIRDFNWAALGAGRISAVRTEFGTRNEVVARGCYIQNEGGNNADAEGANEVELRAGRAKTVANGVMVFEPAEAAFSQINLAVSRHEWFRKAAENPDGREDRYTIILPVDMAAELGIKESDIFDGEGRRKPVAQLPKVWMMNFVWSVIGILDPAKADRIRDVNGKSLAVVDYLRSSITTSQGSGFVENEGATYHMKWSRLVIVPSSAIKDVQGKWRSLAVKFAEGEDSKKFLHDAKLRLNAAMFGSVDGRLSLFTTTIARSVGGLAKILVPIILCILIVANTMMGTVEERKGEVQMLGAIGLSPKQIAFLLMSESTVFSVLGIVFGTFAGLAFSRVLVFFPGFLSDLSFNFTSLASTGLAMGTGVIVLLATLLPARRAAALAAPSGMDKWVLPAPSEGGTIDFPLPFTLTRGNAVGMAAFIRRFLLNHTEATSQDFNCREVKVAVESAGEDAVLVHARMWLEPYDLDVAEIMEMRIRPTATEAVFGVAILMRRTSGTEEAWLRTNYRFMDLVRQQFLIWRNMDKASRQRFIDEGAGLLKAVLAAEQK